MVHLLTKNPNLGKFWIVLKWKMLEYFMAIWSMLRPIGILYDLFGNLEAFGLFYPVLVYCITKNLAIVRQNGFMVEPVREKCRTIYIDTYVHIFNSKKYIPTQYKLESRQGITVNQELPYLYRMHCSCAVFVIEK
jgi:hypothetical protein